MTGSPSLLLVLVAYGGDTRARNTALELLAHAEADGLEARAVVVDNFERYSHDDKQHIRAEWTAAPASALCVDLIPGATPPAIPPDARCSYYFTNENLGYARGNNLGFRLGGGAAVPYLLIATPDVHLETRGGLRRLVETLDAHPEAGCVGPRVLDSRGVPQGPYRFQGAGRRYGSLLWAPLTYIRRRRYFADEIMHGIEHGPVYRIMGCCMLFRSVDFAGVGGFDAGTFLYAEEAIMAERLRSQKKSVYFDAAVVVRHEAGETISTLHDNAHRLRMRFESDMYYYRTYRRAGPLSRAWARLGLFVFLRIWTPLARHLRTRV